MLSAFKNFIITFLVAALVFGAVAYFVTQFLTETITGIFDSESSELDSILHPTDDSGALPSDTTAPDSTENPDTPPEKVINGNSFNMLFIVTDYQPDLFGDYYPDDEALAELESVGMTTGVLGAEYRHPRAVSVLLLRADKERRTFTYTVFPAITRVSTSSGEHTLGDIYHLYGRDYIVDVVSGMTGLTVDHYFLINITELHTAVSEMGGFPLYLTKELYYNGNIATAEKPDDSMASALPLLYPIGKNEIDGPGAMALMMWEDYSNETAFNERNILLVNFLQEMLKKLTALPEAEFTDYYDRICEAALADTTFTPKDLVAATELIYAMNDETFTVKVLDYPGKYVAATETEDARFEADTAKGIALFKNYRKVISGS